MGWEATGIAKRHWPFKTFADTFAGALASGDQIIEFSKLTLGLLAAQLEAHRNLDVSGNPFLFEDRTSLSIEFNRPWRIFRGDAERRRLAPR